MTIEDEAQLSSLLRLQFPGLVFIDGSSWNSSKKIEHLSIADCSSDTVYLWNKFTSQTISLQNADSKGICKGTGTAFLFEFSRCVTKTATQLSQTNLLFSDVYHLINGTFLLSGVMYFSCSNKNLSEELKPFILGTWSIVKKYCRYRVDKIAPLNHEILEPCLKEYLVGSHVVEWCFSSQDKLLKNRSSLHFYLPCSMETPRNSSNTK